jgi:hypothetical protein
MYLVVPLCCQVAEKYLSVTPADLHLLIPNWALWFEYPEIQQGDEVKVSRMNWLKFETVAILFSVELLTSPVEVNAFVPVS